MDTNGPSSREKLLQEMEQNRLESFGAINQRAGIRGEWPNLDLKSQNFPQPLVSISQKGKPDSAVRG